MVIVFRYRLFADAKVVVRLFPKHSDRIRHLHAIADIDKRIAQVIVSDGTGVF